MIQGNVKSVGHQSGASAVPADLKRMNFTGSLCDCKFIVKHHKCPNCRDPTTVVDIRHTSLLGKQVLIIGDSLAWQLHQTLNCMYHNAPHEIQWDFRGMHMFPVNETELEHALEGFLSLKNYSALVIATGTWYNWDWREQQHSSIDDPRTKSQRIFNEQCSLEAKEYFQTNPFRASRVYEFAMQIRQRCHALLQYEAFYSGLSMLQSILHRNKDKWPVAIWKQTAAQHYNTSSGNFDINVSPLSLTCVGVSNTTQAYSRNAVAESILQIPMIQTFEAELSAFGQNMGGKDCTHYCNPSPITLYWVDETIKVLDMQLREMASKTSLV
eukprot:CAMPEP_0172447250 /NCGR_PEP_ID=MMETSP1065-20121228/6591_1 /TAXON_ID=265537 /ORGANISM="Amphiprora paludosa, Strain CCMP125" /LENGTH=325 /DNA_ID=CAMNT_0013198497 /DNA_START=214 /DNA_END=1191 /DNA_ORIENTATION=-